MVTSSLRGLAWTTGANPNKVIAAIDIFFKLNHLDIKKSAPYTTIKPYNRS